MLFSRDYQTISQNQYVCQIFCYILFQISASPILQLPLPLYDQIQGYDTFLNLAQETYLETIQL